MTSDDKKRIAAVCRGLDGMALAIELAPPGSRRSGSMGSKLGWSSWRRERR